MTLILSEDEKNRLRKTQKNILKEFQFPNISLPGSGAINIDFSPRSGDKHITTGTKQFGDMGPDLGPDLTNIKSLKGDTDPHVSLGWDSDGEDDAVAALDADDAIDDLDADVAIEDLDADDAIDELDADDTITDMDMGDEIAADYEMDGMSDKYSLAEQVNRVRELNYKMRMIAEKDDKWMQKADKDIEKRGTEGVFHKWCDDHGYDGGCDSKCWSAAKKEGGVWTKRAGLAKAFCESKK